MREKRETVQTSQKIEMWASSCSRASYVSTNTLTTTAIYLYSMALWVPSNQSVGPCKTREEDALQAPRVDRDRTTRPLKLNEKTLNYETLNPKLLDPKPNPKP